MAHLWSAARRGEIDRTAARAQLDHMRALDIRLLGNRVLRNFAWTHAGRFGREDRFIAESAFATGCAVPVHEAAIGVGAHHVDIGTGCEVFGVARSDLEITGVPVRTVHHMMAVAGSPCKDRTVAGALLHAGLRGETRDRNGLIVTAAIWPPVPFPRARPSPTWRVASGLVASVAS
jgi:hypothetical protein